MGKKWKEVSKRFLKDASLNSIDEIKNALKERYKALVKNEDSY